MHDLLHALLHRHIHNLLTSQGTHGPDSQAFNRVVRRRLQLDYTVLYCTILYCTILHSTKLYYTMLYWTRSTGPCLDVEVMSALLLDHLWHMHHLLLGSTGEIEKKHGMLAIKMITPMT